MGIAHRPRGRGALRGESEYDEDDEDGEAAEASEEETAQPIADATIDLAAGARYRATGKRKTAVARVILKPGTGAYTINGRTLDEYFPRPTLQRNDPPAARDGRLRGEDGRRRQDARRRRLRPGRRPAPRHLARAARGRPQPPLRAQAPRLPHARPAREGAQEGRPQEGPQAAAVLQALATRRLTRKLFGTDGVRGVAGEFLTAELALALARAATARVADRARPPRVLVIRDTRESGEMLEAAVAAGVAAAGGEALLGGVLPTPGAPLLIGRYGLDLGVVISASHNPYRDNGIKFFGGDGFKLSDETELEIEARARGPPRAPAAHRPRPHAPRRARGLPARARTSASPASTCSGRAHRARLRQRRDLPRRAGDLPPPRRRASTCSPPTRRAQHQRRLRLDPRRAARRARCASGGHDVGFAFDGDGDRVLAVDRTGAVVDGDELIALAALHLRAADRCPATASR